MLWVEKSHQRITTVAEEVAGHVGPCTLLAGQAKAAPSLPETILVIEFAETAVDNFKVELLIFHQLQIDRTGRHCHW